MAVMCVALASGGRYTRRARLPPQTGYMDWLSDEWVCAETATVTAECCAEHSAEVLTAKEATFTPSGELREEPADRTAEPARKSGPTSTTLVRHPPSAPPCEVCRRYAR